MPRQIASTGRPRRTASRINGKVVASRSGSCRISASSGWSPYSLGWTLEGLPVSSRPSRASSTLRMSTWDPIAGISTGRHPVAATTAFGYLSATVWKIRSLTVRTQAGIPTIGITRAGIRLDSILVVSSGCGVGILVYKEFGIERHTELLLGQRYHGSVALLIDDGPLAQRQRLIAELHRQIAVVGRLGIDDRDPQRIRAARKAGDDEIIEADRHAQQKPGRGELQPNLRHLGQLSIDIVDVEAIGDQHDRCRRIVLETHPARPFHPQPASGGAAIGGILLKTGRHRADPVQISRNPLQIGLVLRGQGYRLRQCIGP